MQGAASRPPRRSEVPAEPSCPSRCHGKARMCGRPGSLTTSSPGIPAAGCWPSAQRSHATGDLLSAASVGEPGAFPDRGRSQGAPPGTCRPLQSLWGYRLFLPAPPSCYRCLSLLRGAPTPSGTVLGAPLTLAKPGQAVTQAWPASGAPPPPKNRRRCITAARNPSPSGPAPRAPMLRTGGRLRAEQGHPRLSPGATSGWSRTLSQPPASPTTELRVPSCRIGLAFVTNALWLLKNSWQAAVSWPHPTALCNSGQITRRGHGLFVTGTDACR